MWMCGVIVPHPGLFRIVPLLSIKILLHNRHRAGPRAAVIHGGTSNPVGAGALAFAFSSAAISLARPFRLRSGAEGHQAHPCDGLEPSPIAGGGRSAWASS